MNKLDKLIKNTVNSGENKQIQNIQAVYPGFKYYKSYYLAKDRGINYYIIVFKLDRSLITFLTAANQDYSIYDIDIASMNKIEEKQLKMWISYCKTTARRGK